MPKESVSIYMESIQSTNPLTTAQEMIVEDHELVEANLKFVVRQAHIHQRKHPSVSLMDFISQGNLGLMMAAKNFKRDGKHRFITFAVHHVRKQMNQLVIDRHIKQQRRGVSFLTEDGSSDVKDEKKIQPADTMITHHNPYHDAELADMIERMGEVMEGLESKESEYIKMRYLKGMHLREIAGQFDCTIAWLHYLEKKILAKMRAAF